MYITLDRTKASDFPFVAASDKKRYFGPGLPHVSDIEIELAQCVIPIERGAFPVLRLLRKPACGQAFRADRTAILPKGLYRVPFGLRLGCVFLGYFSARTTILKFFSTRKVAEFAKSLAQDVAKHYPPAIANNPAQVVSQQRLSDILEDVFTRTTDFSREHKLGWYKRAMLGKVFRRELEELGYDKKFVDTTTQGLILYASRNPSLNS